MVKTHFHIENKGFTDYLKLTTNGKDYYFCDDVTIESSDCERLDVDIEFIRAEDYLKAKVKHSFLKLLLNMAKWILSPLLYFVDNQDGMSLDKGYHAFHPFTLKKSFSIDSPDGKQMNIRYIDSRYDKVTKKYSLPLIELQGDGIVQKTEETAFSATILKQEWNTYHIPSFAVILIVMLLLNWLNFSIFAKTIKEIPLYTMPENISRIIGMLFCSLVVVALLVACIVIIIKAYKLYQTVLAYCRDSNLPSAGNQ